MYNPETFNFDWIISKGSFEHEDKQIKSNQDLFDFNRTSMIEIPKESKG